MLSKFENQIIKAKKELSSPKKVTIVSHYNPDGDAVSSSLGLYHFLKKYEHDVKVVLPGEFHEFLKWMPESENIVLYTTDKNKALELIENAEVLFLLDLNEPSRTEKLETAIVSTKAFKILIDHHPMPKEFTDVLISEIVTSSASELVYEFAKRLDDKKLIDATVATCFFTGIMSDTGCFNYNCSLPQTFRNIAELLSYGINKDEIIGSFYNNFSAQRMRLMGYCLNEKMVVLPELSTGYITITKEEMKRFDHKVGDTEGFVNMPLSINGITVSAFFVEKDDKIKISFRSKGSFDVNLFARKYFNGGGHKNASGGKFFKSLDETVQHFEEMVKMEMKN